MNNKDHLNNTNNKKKIKYHVKNWSEYNKSLIQRGSLTLWISDDIKDWWYETGYETYSDKAIETMLVIQAVRHLNLRSLQGFMESIFKLAGIDISVPNYTTISRRAETFCVTLRVTQKKTVDIILDSTGLKVYGEGEWKVRKHGWSKRRTWKKIHVGISPDGEVRSVATTGNNVHDSNLAKNLLNQEEAYIEHFYGDGAYDKKKVYDILISRNVKFFHIPPQKNAVLKKNSIYPRDINLKEIQKTSREDWKNSSGYHKRSLVETFMFRFKKTFGDEVIFRTNRRQENEILIKCNVLNVFHSLGMPESYAVN